MFTPFSMRDDQLAVAVAWNGSRTFTVYWSPQWTREYSRRLEERECTVWSVDSVDALEPGQAAAAILMRFADWRAGYRTLNDDFHQVEYRWSGQRWRPVAAEVDA